jgi:hypothetical protein
VRTFSSYPACLARALVVASLLVAGGCGGGGSSTTGNSPIPNPGSPQLCNPDSQGTQLARPGPNQSGVSTATTTIEIVSNGNSDTLGRSFSQFDVQLRDNFGNVLLVTNLLNITSDNSGPHPYASDFYYVGTIQGQLQPGALYNAYLNAPNTNCTPGLLGSFST